MKTHRFLEITPKSWSEAKLIGDMCANAYIFRGHTQNEWELETTLRRAIQFQSYMGQSIKIRERQILKKFRSRAHQYIQSPPSDKEYIEWFSLIQDHGGPSRLLDFTGSFYIASFFALESVDNVGCVWGINPHRLFLSLLSQNVKQNVEFFNELKVDFGKHYLGEAEILLRYAESFFEEETKAKSLVLKVIPPRLNERLAVQKGVFLFPCNIEESFEYNLCKTLKFPFENLRSINATELNYEGFIKERIQISHDEQSQHPEDFIAVVKINMPKEFRNDALLDLNRMNINYASLFPGLDGFAKSLKMDFDFPASISITNSPIESPNGSNSDVDNHPVG